MIRINKSNLLKAIFILFVISLIIIAVKQLFPETEAQGNPTSIYVTFNSGNFSAFNDKTLEMEINENNRIKLPESFSQTVEVIVEEQNKVDVETFYFDSDWETNEEVYAYSFTGWHVVGTDDFIPSNTVFQPKDYIFLDNLDITDNSITLEAVWGKVYFIRNPYEEMVYVENADTFYELDETNSQNPTGASDLNLGNREDAPLATIDCLYEKLRQDASLQKQDAYHTVVMLTGELDYYKNNVDSNTSNYYGYGEGFNADNPTGSTVVVRSATYKSLQKVEGTVFEYNYKPKGYYNRIYGSMRFDNVNFKAAPKNVFGSQAIGTEFELFSTESVNNYYFELTHRFVGTFVTFRPSRTSVVVANGGKFNSWQFNWSSSDTNGSPRKWYVGNTANITGALTMGTTAGYTTSVQTVKGTVELTVTGGKITTIQGGNNGINTISVGNRKIKIVGDGSGNTTTDPQITNIYGGSGQGRLFGNVSISINSCTNIKNVYGGGKDYTATTYGNIDIDVNNSTISGDLYGGGYNANTELVQETYTQYTYKKEVMGETIENVTDLNFNDYSLTVGIGGDVKVNVKNSTVKGNIFGSGQGSSQTMTLQQQIKAYSSGWYSEVGAGTVYPDEWDIPYQDYPRYDSQTGQIVVGAYRGISWSSFNPNNITFTNTFIQAYLSLATVENVNITIDSSIVGVEDGTKGNIYGGGSIAKVHQNTVITIKGDSIIYGNIYGGGDGATAPEAVTLYKPLDSYTAPSYNIDSLEGTGSNLRPTISTKSQSPAYTTNVYGSFTWSADESLLNSDTPGIDMTNKLLYSPNAVGLGSVDGNATVEVTDNTTVYGSVYGGGNAGVVFVDTNVIISGGTVKQNVYGGGDSGTVQGNTKVYVGNTQNLSVTVTGLVYGGGKGYDPDGDGDASEFITVYGSSEVDIQGINTNVENYGSVKLGKVVENVDVVFKDYWTGNATSKYKTMNGIDRATTVTFENSYVLLENKDESNNLVGIKDITNLEIPKGSGLKISAEGKIAGDFRGGGELYLDSAVCLTVEGDISGVTTLILNPKLEADMNVIKGGLQKPYMKVKGEALTSEEQGQAVVSGEKKYTIYEASKEDTGTEYIYYYIPQDVTITSEITITSINALDRIYQGQINNTEDIGITTDGSFTNQIHINYELTESETLENEYTNMERIFALKIEKEELLTIPKGTQIVMVTNGNYYYYIVPANIEEISLSEFTNIAKEKYTQLANFTTSQLVDSELNQVTGLTTYRYNEEFRFIVDFSKAEEKVKTGVYYPMINIMDNDVWMDEGQAESATNTVKIQERTYEYTYNLDRQKYEKNGKIAIDGQLKISSVLETQNQVGKQLSIRMKLQDSEENLVGFPDNTIIKVNDAECTISNSIAEVNIIEALTSSEIIQNMNIEIDMKNVLPQNRLNAAEYKIQAELVLANDGILSENNLEEFLIPINIISYENLETSNIEENYGIKLDIVDTTMEEDKIQLIEQGEDNNRTISLQYSGSLETPKVNIVVQERTAPFTYENTNSANKIITKVNDVATRQITSITESQNVIIEFGSDIPKGTYRILFELYDAHGTKKTQSFVNFVVEEF